MPLENPMSHFTVNGISNLQTTLSRVTNGCSCFTKCTKFKKRNKVGDDGSLPPGWEYLELKSHTIRIIHHIPTNSRFLSEELLPVIIESSNGCKNHLDLGDGSKTLEIINEQTTPNEGQSSAGVDNRGFCIEDIDQTIESNINGTAAQYTIRPLLFFLHGLGGSADVWKDQMDFFVGQGYEVVAFDMLGHGFSSSPYKARHYTFRKLLCDALNVFDNYVVSNRKCVVIGHSYGASFSAAISRYRSSQVVLLIMISSGGPAPLIPKNSKLHYSTCLLSCIKPLLFCGFHREIFYSPRGKQLKFTDAYDIPQYVFSNILKGQYWPEGDVVFHKRISIPTLLVYGLKDQLVNLVEECDMERTIPRAHLELIPSAGHMIMLESPQELNKLISNFICKWSK